METKEDQPNTNEITNQKSSLGKLKKNGEPRKQLTEEQKARRVEILAKGRAIAHEKRRELERMKKENPPTIKSVPEPVPESVPESVPEPVPERSTRKAEPTMKENDESEPETLKLMSIPKKKKRGKKKIIIMDESSSSSEEEVIVRKKNKPKRKPTPPPPVQPPAPAPVLKPSIPEPSQEEIDKLRKEKIRRMKEKEKKDLMMNSIFG